MSHLTKPEAAVYFEEQFIQLARQSYDAVAAIHLRADHADYRFAEPGRTVPMIRGDPTDAILFERRDHRTRSD